MAATNPLPPGGNGLPLLGETIAFANNPFGFIRELHARFGDVFRTNILGSPTVFFVGPKLAATYLDPAKIQREGAMPANLTALFGGNPDIVPLLDGDAHAQRKRSLLGRFRATPSRATCRICRAGSKRSLRTGSRMARGR